MPKNAKHFFHFLTVLVEFEAVGSWSSGGWLNVEMTSSASPSSSSPSSSLSWFSGSTAILFCFENTLSFCCRFIMKHKHKNKVEASIDRLSAKCWSRLQSLFLELLGTPDTKCTHTHVVWNASHFARSFQATVVSTHICFNLLLLLPAALEVLIYEVTCFFVLCLFVCLFVFFFASVWLGDHFILRQNRLFRVNDAKSRPRLNTETTINFWVVGHGRLNCN